MTSYAATHKVSEFKKIYPTFYLFHRDNYLLNKETSDFIVWGDPYSEFKKFKMITAYLKGFELLKMRLKEMGFTLMNNPTDADAIAAYRVQIGNSDPMLARGYEAYIASLRFIDPKTKDTLMLVSTETKELIMIRNIDNETEELVRRIAKEE
jgi:hypothetical protein